MARRRVAVVVGTRPEAIKLAPVVQQMRQRPDCFDTVVVATAQHRQMLDQALSLFGIEPDIDLNVMRPNQSLSELTCAVLRAMDATLTEIQADLVLVQGDTTTALVSGLAALYARVPVGHVEAGLRSDDLRNPFPEEANRRLLTVMSEIHMAPTANARQRLLDEGVAAHRIVVTGNTVVDALLGLLEMPFRSEGTPLADLPLEGHRVLLVTSHRRESWGDDLRAICQALREVVQTFPDLLVVYPVHMNPNVRETVTRALAGTDRIRLLPPLDYLTFVNLLRRSHVVLTDSGGVQEEAPTLRKPVLVVRNVTERPEAAGAGMARIIGTSTRRIVEEVSGLLTDPAAYRRMTAGANPYGDGRAAQRILEVLTRWSAGQYPLAEPEHEFRVASASGDVR